MGIADAQLQGFSCAAHSLSLALNDSLFSQRAVNDMISIAKKMVGHFNKSASACYAFYFNVCYTVLLRGALVKGMRLCSKQCCGLFLFRNLYLPGKIS